MALTAVRIGGHGLQALNIDYLFTASAYLDRSRRKVAKDIEVAAEYLVEAFLDCSNLLERLACAGFDYELDEFLDVGLGDLLLLAAGAQLKLVSI